MYLPLLLWRYKTHLFTYAFLFELKKLNCSARTSVWEIVIGWRQQVDLLWRSGSQPGKSDGTVKGFATFAIYTNTWWQLKSLPISSEETHICEGVSESPLSLSGLLWLLPNNLQCSRTWPWWPIDKQYLETKYQAIFLSSNDSKVLKVANVLFPSDCKQQAETFHPAVWLEADSMCIHVPNIQDSLFWLIWA